MDETLFEYGIQTEISDIRAHVSVVNRTIYVFQTRNGIAAITEHDPPLRSAGQDGVKGRTAEGWLVQVDWIADLRRVKFYSWPHWDALGRATSTSEKGALAVRCVVESMRAGRFPFWIDTEEDERYNVQIKGADLVVFAKKKVQVKCDARCGDLPLGTGNVFLQKAERNPRKAR